MERGCDAGSECLQVASGLRAEDTAAIWKAGSRPFSKGRGSSFRGARRAVRWLKFGQNTKVSNITISKDLLDARDLCLIPR